MNKLKVEIDLDDIWNEEEESLSETLILSIKHTILFELKKLIKETMDSQIEKYSSEYLKRIGEGQLDKKVKSEIDKKLEGLMVKQGNYSKEPIPLEELLSKMVGKKIDKQISSTLNSYVNTTTDMAIKALQLRYDEKYAITIITKLQEGGFLSSKAQSVLLDDSNKEGE